jgi:hypothetical protein
MNPKEVLKKLISNKWSIILYHEEIEGSNFSATGTFVNDVTGQQLRFEFFREGIGSVLRWFDPREQKL